MSVVNLGMIEEVMSALNVKMKYANLNLVTYLERPSYFTIVPGLVIKTELVRCDIKKARVIRVGYHLGNEEEKFLCDITDHDTYTNRGILKTIREQLGQVLFTKLFENGFMDNLEFDNKKFEKAKKLFCKGHTFTPMPFKHLASVDLEF